MQLIRVFIAAAILMLLRSADVLGQNPHRQKFWMELGSGPSAIRINCTGCENVTRATGTGGLFRFGWTLSPKVLLGVETFGFNDDSFVFGSGDESIIADCSSVGAVVLWYPWRSHFFIKSGTGLAAGVFTVTPEEGEPLEAEGVGVGLTFGIGLDIPVSRKIALTFNASTYFTAIGDIVLPNRVVDDVIPTTYLLSFGVVLR